MKRNGRNRVKKRLFVNYCSFVFLVFLHNVYYYGTTTAATVTENMSSSSSSSGIQPKAKGRQLSSSSSKLGTYAQNIKPIFASSRESHPSPNYNQQPLSSLSSTSDYYNSGSSAYSDPNQLSYSPSAAAQAYYYYQNYPNLRTKYNYAQNYDGGSNDYSIQNNIVEEPEPSFLRKFFRDLLPSMTNEADSKTDITSLTGLATLVVTSLSGLSWVAIAVLIIVLAPVLIPVVISPLLFLGILVYFIPVLRFEVPGDARKTKATISSRALSVLNHLDTTAHFYKRIAQSEECIEKMSCELARLTTGNLYWVENWIVKKLENSSNKWLHRISKSFKAAKAGHNCQIFSCDPTSQLRKVLHTKHEESI